MLSLFPRVRQAAEFGCGQGAVLSLLTLPAQHLDEFPSLYPPAPYTSSPSSPSAPTALRTQKLDVLRSIPRRDPTENELHLNRVIGVDINHESLLQARKVVEPPKQVEKRAEDEWSPRQPERWEELSVQLYEGGLEVYNESLENIEAMVLTEVRFRAEDRWLGAARPNANFGALPVRLSSTSPPPPSASSLTLSSTSTARVSSSSPHPTTTSTHTLSPRRRTTNRSTASPIPRAAPTEFSAMRTIGLR